MATANSGMMGKSQEIKCAALFSCPCASYAFHAIDNLASQCGQIGQRTLALQTSCLLPETLQLLS